MTDENDVPICGCGDSLDTTEARKCGACIDCAQQQLARLQGAVRADDGRLRLAAERVGVASGCDAAEEMADIILWLRLVIAQLPPDVFYDAALAARQVVVKK
jgi:hypothetical protein